MTQTAFIIWILLSAFFLLLVLLYLWNYLSANVLNPDGKNADKKTRGVLSRYALPRRFKVLSHIKLEENGKTAYAESILIGYFGILVVTTCGARGEYYGQISDSEWILVRDKTRKTFPNPLHEQDRFISMMRTLLAKNKIYNIPVERVVVISSKAKKTGMFITNGGEIITGGKLSRYLDKARFEKDTGLDVNKIAAVLEAR